MAQVNESPWMLQRSYHPDKDCTFSHVPWPPTLPCPDFLCFPCDQVKIPTTQAASLASHLNSQTYLVRSPMAAWQKKCWKFLDWRCSSLGAKPSKLSEKAIQARKGKDPAMSSFGPPTFLRLTANDWQQAESVDPSPFLPFTTGPRPYTLFCYFNIA